MVPQTIVVIGNRGTGKTDTARTIRDYLCRVQLLFGQNDDDEFMQ
jgi:myosin heavy subunit